MQLTLAEISDASEICALMNDAYRGSHGWTTEQDLVSGARATTEQIAEAISSRTSDFLIHKIEGKIVSCINVEIQNKVVHIGSFAVSPKFQALGIGSRVIAAAERYAGETYSPKKFSLVVLSPRKELIAFYERRGYKRTGNTSVFPAYLNVGWPKVSNLTVEELEKNA
jgi:N-acetylglutamate synthase-like GNAT family acetyltransferase